MPLILAHAPGLMLELVALYLLLFIFVVGILLPVILMMPAQPSPTRWRRWLRFDIGLLLNTLALLYCMAFCWTVTDDLDLSTPLPVLMFSAATLFIGAEGLVIWRRRRELARLKTNHPHPFPPPHHHEP